MARNVKWDTIQDSFAALLPLLYRGRCRSIAMVRRSFNIETLFVSWTIFSAHIDTPLTDGALYYATAPRRTVGTPAALSATPVDRCARPAGISRGSGRSSLASIAKGRCPSLACLASARMELAAAAALPQLNHQLLAASRAIARLLINSERCMRPPCSRSAAPDGAATHMRVQRLAHESPSSSSVPADRDRRSLPNAPG